MGLRIGECRVAILALLHVSPVVSFGSSDGDGDRNNDDGDDDDDDDDDGDDDSIDTMHDGCSCPRIVRA